MIITFYDKDLTPISDNSSLNVGDWDLKREAVEFDSFTCTSEPFLFQIQPTFMVIKDDLGVYKYGCFAGIPTLTADNQTKETGSDLKTYFNNNMVVRLNTTYTYLEEYFDEIFQAFSNSVNSNGFTCELDTSDISEIEIGSLTPAMTDYENKNVWADLIQPYLKYYDLYMTSKIDLANKKLIFYIKKANKNSLAIHLDDYGILNFGKYISSLNEVITYVNVNKGTSISVGHYAILKKDNSVEVFTDSALANSAKDIFPTKVQTIIKTTTSTATADIAKLKEEALEEAIEKLANARYNEAIELTADQTLKLAEADFSTNFQLYYKSGNSYVFYKNLPLGAIEEGRKSGVDIQLIYTIGYKLGSLIFYIK